MKWMRFRGLPLLVVCAMQRAITSDHVQEINLGGQMEPGPVDDSILKLQENHRSSVIWEGEDLPPLKCRNHLYSKSKFTVDPAVENFISGTQFHGIHRLAYVVARPDMITALVERWRQETHTFHLTVGEATITLQDVNVLLGLKVGGLPITGKSDYFWPELLEHHLGIRPPPTAFKGKTLKLSWLRAHFQGLPQDATQQHLHAHVKAYLLYLIGTVLFPDKSGNRVQLIYFPLLTNLERLNEYSWGSGTLAYLYRNLCTACTRGAIEIGGCLVLMQLWAWERISIGRPTIMKSTVEEQAGVEYPLGSQVVEGVDPLGCRWLRIHRAYRDHLIGLIQCRHALDTMTDTMFTWEPYPTEVLSLLPAICTEDPTEWIVNAPLICFEAVEWHFPNRVVRQFGWHPTIPPMCKTSKKLHKIDRRGTANDYEDLHKESIVKWNNRKSRLTPRGVPYNGYLDYNDAYLQWYRAITRLVVSNLSTETQSKDLYEKKHNFYPNAADNMLLAEGHLYNYRHATTMLGNMPEDVPLSHLGMLREMQTMSLECLQRTGHGNLVPPIETDHPSPQRQPPPRYHLRHLEHRLTPIREEETPTGSSSRPKKTRSRLG
ncbi:serine/threonine-protein phosphatase 7 long form homolog isoform X1 [Silene latifolia]|uniref:serine/threonine-protein phosphatase 7 long form homolog isoform X1 n=2 Tax=Silene latifolia TaxID=37657 RepID=UPI003D77A725